MKKRKPLPAPFWRFLFVIYTAGLLWLLFGRTPDWNQAVPYAIQLRRNCNLVPFRTITNYWTVVKRLEFTPLFYHCLINLWGNVLLFLPIGFLLPRLWPALRKFPRFLLTGTIAIALVEVLQLVTLLGSLDIDDLILNLCGMLVGYGCFQLNKKKGKL